MAHNSAKLLAEGSPLGVESYDSLRVSITARNAHASPLLRLPGEVRNIIYGFLLCNGAALEFKALFYVKRPFYVLRSPNSVF
ncbi:hypothetical protein CC86DRAFT_401753 [Ophiobolus disseminans]|uniref:Uncharacterized protein n=1 Tax=Ophiobolus disseminans TaxID=1469910 RepID=A0A6A7AD86_9PLEO|nr:hypothetical protein CC86DRAFT_401753 [Ophiobolus disseminans]